MPLQTTVVGAWPKPDYLNLPDWFSAGHKAFDPREHDKARRDNKEIPKLVQRAVKETVDAQVKLGLDVVSDGEMGRDNYIWHFCRKLNGVDFTEMSRKVMRDGACEALLPIIRGPLSHKEEPSCFKEWAEAQSWTKIPVKYTLPGPLTISDTTQNESGLSTEEVMKQAAKCINAEVKALVLAGCKHIQIDEPCFLRHPDIAVSYGVEIANSCFDGVDNQDVERIIHLCCGYPNHLDMDDYKKADKNLYFKILPLLDKSNYTVVSIEDKEAQNDLKLLSEVKQLKIILGSVAVARSKIETVEEIKNRLLEALKYIPSERLMVAPDCGLGFLTYDMVQKKLDSMVKAAKSV